MVIFSLLLGIKNDEDSGPTIPEKKEKVKACNYLSRERMLEDQVLYFFLNLL